MTQASAIALAMLLVCGLAVALVPAASALPSPIHCTVGPGVECTVDVCVTPPYCVDETVKIRP